MQNICKLFQKSNLNVLIRNSQRKINYIPNVGKTILRYATSFEIQHLFPKNPFKGNSFPNIEKVSTNTFECLNVFETAFPNLRTVELDTLTRCDETLTLSELKEFPRTCFQKQVKKLIVEKEICFESGQIDCKYIRFLICMVGWLSELKDIKIKFYKMFCETSSMIDLSDYNEEGVLNFVRGVDRNRKLKKIVCEGVSEVVAKKVKECFVRHEVADKLTELIVL